MEYMVRVLGKNTKAHFFIMGIPATVDIDVKQKNTDVQDQARPPKRKTVPSETTCDDTDPSSPSLSF